MTEDSVDIASVKGPYLRPQAAAKYLNLAPSTLWSLVARGRLPRPIKLSPGVTLFPQSELDAALARRVGAEESFRIQPASKRH